MFPLDEERRRAAWEAYRANPAFFPLIGAVLVGEQDGVVYADDTAPRQFYVEHAFGFAQVFGESRPAFENALERYLLVDKSFAAAKVRLYTPLLPAFLEDSNLDGLRSLRQRFEISESALATRFDDHARGSGLEAVPVDRGNALDLDAHFGVATRFWRTHDDFAEGANAVVALDHGRPAGICYAAAVADRQAEIDVLTLPEYRTRGVGTFVVIEFVRRCLERSLRPLWDCFTNNAGSMRLAHSTGFTPVRPPYPFYTIAR